MVAARKTLAVVLCALPALASTGISEEPLCDTDGNDATCATPPGHSVLQRTSQLHGHSASVTEGENTTMPEAAVTRSICVDGVRWRWEQGDGIGGSDHLIGTSVLQKGCQELCTRKSRDDPAINGCTFSHSRMQCYAEKGMKSRKESSGDWITSFVPPACGRFEVARVIKARGHKRRFLGFDPLFYPCGMYNKHSITLHHGAVITRGIVKVSRVGKRGGFTAISCDEDPKICSSAKEGDYFFFDGCP
mmetsp:Transcript_105601/g.330889  ORF Transcript_105601/g.330889 Transcript_105601/m.330889 type:complete len:247 (-) Transcript_105601:178-918(-)